MSWLQSTIHHSVSFLKASIGGVGYFGTGFFYARTADGSLKTGGWHVLDSVYLITAKHNVLITDEEHGIENQVCDNLEIAYTFFDAKNPAVPAGKISVVMTQKDLQTRILYHKNEDVDLVAISLEGFPVEVGGQTIELQHLKTSYLTRSSLPKYSDMLSVEVTSDIIVFGFPYGHFDNHNRFPLSKSGIIASGWGLDFNNQPVFKIDVELYQGSSGSPVISKPVNFAVRDGKMYTNEDPRFLLLGVYTGESQFAFEEETVIKTEDADVSATIEQAKSLGFGTVHYADLIDDIV